MKLLKPACFTLLLFLSACHVMEDVTFPVNYTPKSYFKPDTTTILLINRVDLNKTQIHNQKRLDVIRAGAYTSISYAQKALATLPHVKVINSVDSANFIVNTDSVNTLAAKYHANYVLALKNFSADVPLTDLQNSTMYYTTNVAVGYFLYQANGIYYKKLNGTVTDPNAEIAYDNILSAVISHPTIKNSKTAIKTSAEHATQDALQDYLPYAVIHQRLLYTDDYLKPAVKEILAKNYVNAEHLLQPLIKNTSAEIAGKAMYNLAIVYEAEGDIPGATYMAKQSLAKFKSNTTVELIDELKQD